jgi:hypothetical protein
MSTNGIIARATGENKFEGRYHHWDSYPSGLGKSLVNLYRGYFQRDLTSMLKVLLDDHTGWSTIVEKDFTLKAGYTNPKSSGKMSFVDFQKLPRQRRPQCYCHGERKEQNPVLDQDSDCGAEYAYVFETVDTDDKQSNILHVLYRAKNKDTGEYHWSEAGRIDLDSDEEINWTPIECGEKFERCRHYAWYHNLLPKTSNLATVTYLGYRPLDFHDVIAFKIRGRIYRSTGSGVRVGDYWVSSVIDSSDRRADVKTAVVQNGEYFPAPGVKWIYPTVNKKNGESST